MLDDLPEDSTVAVCCSGGGIRSAAFNLGALQVLQDREDVYRKVTTVTAVSGGSYIAAAHAIAARALAAEVDPGGGRAYALGSPEETHLRDHTRYLLEDWQVTLRGLGHLVWGLLINVLLVSSALYVVAHVVGWALRFGGVLHSNGTQRASVDVDLVLWITAALVVAAAVAVMRGGRAPAGPVAVGVTAAPPKRRTTAALVTAAALAALLLVATPYAVQGLDTLGRQDNPTGRAVHAVWSAIGQTSGPGVSSLAVFVSALAMLVRTTMGRVRMLERDLRGSGLLGAASQKAVAWLRDRLTPWVGATLVVVVFGLLFLRWVGAASGVATHHGAWWASQPATTAYALLVLVAIKLFIDVNETSLHGFYRDRIASAYAVTREGPGAVRPAGDTLLSDLRRSAPELVVCAAANCTETGSLPPGRRCVSFTFTADSVGVSTGASVAEGPGRERIATQHFERHGMFRRSRPFTAFDAVAVSGAAVSPLMGKLTRPSHRLLFTIANVRLGVWVRAPWWMHEHAGKTSPATTTAGRLREELTRRFRQPDLRHLYAEALGSLHLDGRWLYVTDGGHYENLGLIEALRRRADAVIVVDASADGGRCSTLGQAIALARTECGVQIDIDPRSTFAAGKAPSRTGTVVGTFTYPDEPLVPHHLLYARLAVPGDAPWDVQAYYQASATFPTDSTLQQLYDADEFEAYRALGAHAATSLLSARAPVPTT